MHPFSGSETFNVPKSDAWVASSQSQKPRLLKMKCPDIESKESLMKNKMKLRRHGKYKSCFINDDLTELQQQQHKLLRIELRERRERKENVMIRGWKIVERADKRQNF